MDKLGQFETFGMTAFGQARIFAKNAALSILGVYGFSTSCKISKKENKKQMS